MSTPMVTILGCTVVTFAIKAVGPVALGGRELPGWVAGVIALMAPAVLAALVVTSALADGKVITIGEDTAGVAVAGVLAWRKQSIIICVVAAAAVTAGLRAL